MTGLRVLLGFLVGVALYQVGVVTIGGMLAATTIPRSYFAWFGRSNLELAHALSQLATFSLPVFVFVAGGTLAAYRLLRLKSLLALTSVLAGLLACFIFWVAAGALVVPTDLPVEPYPPSILLRQILLPPWWAVSGFLAPWLGFAFAAWLASRKAAVRPNPSLNTPTRYGRRCKPGSRHSCIIANQAYSAYLRGRG
jgi:hypothetical protein